MALYRRDLAYVHAAGFETWIRAAAPGLLRTPRRAGVAPGGRVVVVGCVARARTAVGFDVTIGRLGSAPLGSNRVAFLARRR